MTALDMFSYRLDAATRRLVAAISVAECKAIDFSSAMAQIALITGITGQDGSYLAEFLLAKGYEVHGVVRRSSTMNRGRIDHLQHANPSHPETSKFVLHYGDMTDSGGLNRLVKTVRPDESYNLAAQSHVAISFDQPEYMGDADGLGTSPLLEGPPTTGPPTRFYPASASCTLCGTAVIPIGPVS